MRAITVNKPGTPEELQFLEVPTPEAGDQEVRIAVAGAGVNRADLLQRRGFYPPPPGTSEILGLEVSGVIDQGCGRWLPGDEVVALLAGGGYAQYVVVPTAQCARVPSGIDLHHSAGIIETAATVVSNFDHIGASKGETLLVHGGAGGVGSFAIPYAKHLGLRVITTVGSPEKARYAVSLGADLAIDYHQDWVEQARAATGDVDLILDIMGAKYLESNLSLLARGGRMCVIGLQSGTKATMDLNQLLTKSATLTATSLRFRPVEEKQAIVAKVEAEVWPLFESGKIPLPTMSFFPLAQARRAHELLESGANIGKIVLTCE